MIFLFQTRYADQVAEVLSDKEHISDGISQAYFLNIILILSLFFIILSCLFSIMMIISRNQKIKKKAYDSRLKEKYQDFLSSFLILPMDEIFLGIKKNGPIDDRLTREDVTKPYHRKLLATEIYELKKMVRGQQESQLRNYFYGLGLQEEVAVLLRSKNWAKKVKAMQMIKSFHIEELLDELNKFIHDKNRELSIHAIVARIAIDKNVQILNSINYNLNAWEVHKIYDEIIHCGINPNLLAPLKIEHQSDQEHFIHSLHSSFSKSEALLQLS